MRKKYDERGSERKRIEDEGKEKGGFGEMKERGRGAGDEVGEKERGRRMVNALGHTALTGARRQAPDRSGPLLSGRRISSRYLQQPWKVHTLTSGSLDGVCRQWGAGPAGGRMDSAVRIEEAAKRPARRADPPAPAVQQGMQNYLQWTYLTYSAT